MGQTPLPAAAFADIMSGTSPSSAERYTRALVNLTRAVWHTDCTFESAVRIICENAAWALDVERVSVWRYDSDTGTLNCVNSWDAVTRIHSGDDNDEALAVDADAYMSMLQDVRTLSSVRPNIGAPRQVHHGVFNDFVRRVRTHAVIDAPACVGGKLNGAICHESTQADRVWTSEEATFAASMGDFVAMAFEINRRSDAEKEVEHLLLHDANTGLGNRDYMVELVRQRLLIPRGLEQPVAIILLLVDSSTISSAVDAPSAEDVIVRIAEDLRQLCGPEIELARVHSNKFAFLLTRTAAQGTAIQFAERCLECMEGVRWEKAEAGLGMAVGIAYAGPGTNEDAAILLRQAEDAAHRARDANDHGYEVFEPAHHDMLVERLRLERMLRHGLAYDEFEVYYQPEYDAVRQQWVAAEALLRWNQGDIVHPAATFIEVAESSGLMVPLGKFVLRQACRDAARWCPTRDGNLLDLRVNVSARQFASRSLVEEVSSALEDSGLSPDRLCLEITETTLMDCIDAALVTLKALQALGVRFAIDDFGTGFGSLVYLRRLPINVIKIDRSFVSGLPASRVDSAIVSGIVGMAGALDIAVVAEGVESIDQQEALIAIGVRNMQGWLYAKAMKQDALLEILLSPVSSPAPKD